MSVNDPVTGRETDADSEHRASLGSYVLAVLGYIVLGWFTKHFLTITYGLLYFALVLEVIPRLFRWIRGPLSPARTDGP